MTRAPTPTTGLPTIRASKEVLGLRELVPFAAAVVAGAPAVMTSHLVVEALDPGSAATFSPVLLSDLLRDELGFEGVIVTDALDMVGAQGSGPGALGVPGAAVRAVAAGADLLCLGPESATDTPTLIQQVVDAITAAVDDGSLATERVLDAARRVEGLRQQWASPHSAQSGLQSPRVDAGRATSLDAARVASLDAARVASLGAARAVHRDLPSLPGARVVHLDTIANPAVGETIWELPAASQPDQRPSVRLSPEDLATARPPAGPSLLVVRGATRDARVWQWIQEALSANGQAWLVELGWPDPQLGTLGRVICTYGASAASTQALATGLADAARSQS
ncbi:hypothetical protein FNH13_07595 [Ornithinimicrobium ciconiae]|uniref:Glycoside hydrolase family 3 N-terminal domain-containing protein n=1 Tax=Ornithinimicrobium ciconiae TaxID=2594265 RepID=A0A516G9R4_9MICO|nr:glycoside hydrolase family 3 N-terminal domain-containing protein [Ornithinimicrobium ciconiae]QDO88225.1 hypothetical protein FNH13_07595 [Ornithinimicrobium ciconiae]